LKILGTDHIIQDFSKLDFSEIIKYLQQKRINSPKRKNVQKDEEFKIFGYVCINNLAKVPCNYYIQPPSIYLGHGNNVYRGCIKKRIQPEDITINCSKPYPKCFVNGVESSWNQVITDPECSWLASWNHPITGETTYLRLKRSSDPWVYVEDYNKFEKARELNKHILSIRQKYERDLKSSDPKLRELALSVYFLDKISIRPGGIEDETVGTQGLTTLKRNNFSIQNGDVTIKFVGKSSIDYVRTVRFKKSALEVLKERISLCDLIFPNTSPTILNNYLRSLMNGLTAKVFRTWKASSTLLLELSEYEFDEDDNLEYKKLIFEQSNIYVARELNHKKMVSNMGMVEKIKKKIRDCDKHSLRQVKLLIKKNEYEENLSLTTSKTNYIDPRIIVAWCKSNDVPIKCIISRKLMERFEWAMDTPSNFQW
jgi:DNA topoisomerase-1